MLQTVVHYFLHFIFIGAIAFLLDKSNWKKVWLILLSTMVVDLDHLFSQPIFDAQRCSIGFHFLHSEIAIIIYSLFFFFSKNKTVTIISLGLLFHMLVDLLDCFWTFSYCNSCFQNSIFY